jgi:hypothetical protein
VVGLHVRRAFGFNDKVDYGTIAANALGSAIGSAAGRGFNAAQRNNNLNSRTPSEDGHTLYDVTANDPFAARQIQDYANESMGGMLSEYGYNATLGGYGTDVDRQANIAADRAPDTRIRTTRPARPSSGAQRFSGVLEQLSDLQQLEAQTLTGLRPGETLIEGVSVSGTGGISGTSRELLNQIQRNAPDLYSRARNIAWRGDANLDAIKYNRQQIPWTASDAQARQIYAGNAAASNRQWSQYISKTYAGTGLSNSTPYASRAYDAGAQQRADLWALLNVPVGVAQGLGNGVAALAQMSSPLFGIYASVTGNDATWEPFKAYNPAQQLGQMLSIPVSMVVAPEAILLKAATAAPRTYTGLRTVRAWEEVGVAGASSGRTYNVWSDGVRGEVPLNIAQRAEVDDYLRNFDLDGVAIRHVDDTNLSTGYLHGDMFSVLNIGSDVVPGNVGLGTLTANSRISMRGTIAHEVVGHREAALAGRTQAIVSLEEAQASIRAARFAPELTSTERFTLLRDGITRLYNDGKRIRDFREFMFIDKR